jgi:NADH-quinone oxidoreductase subunit L
MVAAGVYLAGRFYPMFVPEVLLTIAYVGCITLFLAATIAVVATDIKRVLAYSTISQLGYMMLGLGVGGWGAGLFHLITHAFFKSLMFLASGSVIHGCHHVQEMPQMGGLRRKMPVTAYTMLVGVIAITGLAVPGVIAFSGYHSKDAILATAMTFADLNSTHFLLFYLPLLGAGVTAFYMFRLWFMTFAGEPRDPHVYEHAHESPSVMTMPLVILSLFAAFCAAGGESGPLFKLLLAAEPAGLASGIAPDISGGLAVPGHAAVAERHLAAGSFALLVALAGAASAYVFYAARLVNPGDVQRQFSSLYTFLVQKWWFDELYDVMFVRPVQTIAAWFATFDRVVIDGLLHWSARSAVTVSSWDRRFDEQIIDGFVDRLADVTHAAGNTLRRLQTGRLRQYVMFIVVGVIGIWVVVQIFAS